MKADLHCHTRCSDGSAGLESLIAYAKAQELQAVAVTDHDYLHELKTLEYLSDKYRIKIIPGVELTCFDKKRGRRVHMLCYYYDAVDPLKEVTKAMIEARNEAGLEMIRRVAAYYPVNEQIVGKFSKDSACIYKQHIMLALQEMGYAQKMYGEIYQELFSEQSGSCLVTPEYTEVYRLLDIIKNSRGVAVLAHPSVYDSIDLAGELADAGLIDGIEYSHPRNTEKDKETIKALAQKYHLILTGGTDYHGLNRDSRRTLGSFGCDGDALEALEELAACKRK